MSLFGIKKIGKIRFPTIRRSIDVLQPESGEADFSESLKDFDKEQARTIAETADISKKIIKDNEEREQLKKNKDHENDVNEKNDVNDEYNETSEEDEEVIHIDVRA